MTSSAGSQVRARSRSAVVAPSGLDAGGEGVGGGQVADVADDVAELAQAVLGDVDVEGVDEDPPGGGVLHPVEELPQDPERRRHDAAGHTGVDPLGEHLDGQLHPEETPQRRRDPQPVVAPAPRVEGDDQVGAGETVAEKLEVGGQVGAARLLRRLDQDQAAAVGAAGGPHRLDGRQGGEGGVPVVGAAPAVEAIPVPDGLPGPQALPPLGQRRLLVEVAVEEDVPGPGLPREDGRRHGGAGRRRGPPASARGSPAPRRSPPRSAGPAASRPPGRPPGPCDRRRPSRGRRPPTRWGCG